MRIHGAIYHLHCCGGNPTNLFILKCIIYSTLCHGFLIEPRKHIPSKHHIYVDNMLSERYGPTGSGVNTLKISLKT